MNYQEAQETMAKNIILGCPECLKALEDDKENQTMYCEEHGIFVKNEELK